MRSTKTTFATYRHNRKGNETVKDLEPFLRYLLPPALAAALCRLLDRSLPEDERRKAAAEIVQLGDFPTLAGSKSRYRAWRQLARELQRSPKALLADFLVSGLIKAADDAFEPQFVMLRGAWVRASPRRKDVRAAVRGRAIEPGKVWLRGKKTVKNKVIPNDALSEKQLFDWIRERAYRHAREAIGLDSATEMVALEREARRSYAPLSAASRAVEIAKLVFTATELTPRERAVLDLAGQGWSNAEIASALKCSVATVRVHLHNARRKSTKHD